MNKSLFHFIDISCLSIGACFLLADSMNTAEAAMVLSGSAIGSDFLMPLLSVLGLLLVLIPLARPLFKLLFSNARDEHELQDLEQALSRVALHQRVLAANLYLEHMDDVGLRRIFQSEGDFRKWMAPILQDPALKMQLSPKLQGRLATETA